MNNRPKLSKRKIIIKIRVEINEIESRKMGKGNGNKTEFFEKINKRLAKKKKKKEKINKFFKSLPTLIREKERTYKLPILRMKDEYF